MKKGLIIIGLILLGITAFRVWRIQDVHSVLGTGAASVDAFSPIPSVNKWAGALPTPALNAVFDIVPEKEKAQTTKSARKPVKGKQQSQSQNAKKPKSLPQVFGVFSEEGERYALIQRKPEPSQKNIKSGGKPGKKYQTGYRVIPEGGEVETWVLAEILPTRLLFKVEGEEDHFVTLFKYDEKPLKGK